MVTHAQQVYVLCKDMGGLPSEQVRALMLDASMRLLDSLLVTNGHSSYISLDACQIFRPAICHCAAGIILVHNHPSGNPQPSDQDITLTRRLIRAGDIIGIKLIDHCIVTQGAVYSIRAHADCGFFDDETQKCPRVTFENAHKTRR